MAGLIGVGRNTLSQASGGFQTVAGMEGARQNQIEQMKAARKAQRASTVSTGGGLGASIGVNNAMKQGLIGGTRAVAATTPTVAPTISAVTLPSAPSVMAAPLSAPTAQGLATTTMLPSSAAATTAAATAVPAEIAAAAAGTEAAAGTAAATTATGASTGAMATIGAIATPLLIGAGAALLLDSLFDIF